MQFETRDRLRLNGALAPGGGRMTVIHLHGKCGNFYENKFVRMMYDEYPRAGINFLGFNNRGTACLTEAVIDGRVGYIGTGIERLEDCIHDIDAAISYASGFSDRIVIQGHSFGCEKALYHALHAPSDLELVLLSPSDGYALQNVFMSPETVEEQLERIQQTYGADSGEWLPEREYGIRGPGVEYHVPITAGALAGLISGPAFQLLRLDLPWTQPKLANRSFVYLGGQDGLQVEGAERMAEGVAERMANARIHFDPQGRHDLGPRQNEVIDAIVSWVNERGR